MFFGDFGRYNYFSLCQQYIYQIVALSYCCSISAEKDGFSAKMTRKLGNGKSDFLISICHCWLSGNLLFFTVCLVNQMFFFTLNGEKIDCVLGGNSLFQLIPSKVLLIFRCHLQYTCLVACLTQAILGTGKKLLGSQGNGWCEQQLAVRASMKKSSENGISRIGSLIATPLLNAGTDTFVLFLQYC